MKSNCTFKWVILLWVIFVATPNMKAQNTGDGSLKQTVFYGVDSEAPSVPQNFEYTNITGNSITLSWTASKDNVGVKGYVVYQNNKAIVTDTCTFVTITNLLIKTTYSFEVKAFDFAGNYSAGSNIITLTTSNGYNIAPIAALSTSYLTSGQSLKALNNNILPINSTDVSTGAYGNLNGEASYNKLNYVQYKWPVLKTITAIEVYWWDNGDKIKQPTEAYLQYYDFGTWITLDSIDTELNKFNRITVDVTTSALRLYMKGNYATGVLEWKVIGANGKDKVPPEKPTNLQFSNILSGSVDLKWEPSTDNTGVAGYQIWSDTTLLRTCESNTATAYGLTPESKCTLYVKAYDADGNVSENSDSVTFTTNRAYAEYIWPKYNPTINYNFVNEYGNISMPANILDDCKGVAGTISSDWWCFRWGATKNPLVTEAAINPMLERFNTDFAYFRNIMGWPPDVRALNGYKCAIYLYGSSLCTDNKPNTEKGGWQGVVYYNGINWPIVLASYYPVYSFDPACTYTDKEFQKGAMIHEGIHSVLSSLPGCRQAAWFHEGGNTWLQQEAESRRNGLYTSMGFLNAAAIIAPFMPIECYSGWLQDGSFGGPSAEGVNMFSGGKQICTWKNLLGGTQYGNLFPTFLGQSLGDGSVPWIWKYCTDRVLEGIGSEIGDIQIRRLICEYRAKQAVVDFGVWTKAVIDLLDSNMGKNIQEESSPYNINVDPWSATPYAVTTNDGNGLLTPAAWTTPGWSGANIIPLVVSDTIVSVNFQPKGRNMICQLCYIATDSSRIYSEMVDKGDCFLKLKKTPANNVVFAVICNTDYKYTSDSTRKAHFDYRLKLGRGISGTADITKKWYKGVSVNTKSAKIDLNNVYDISKYCSYGYEKRILSGQNTPSKELTEGSAQLFPNIIDRNGTITIKIDDKLTGIAIYKIIDLNGRIIHTGLINETEFKLNTSGILNRGLYFVTVNEFEKAKVFKLLVQ